MTAIGGKQLLAEDCVADSVAGAWSGSTRAFFQFGSFGDDSGAGTEYADQASQASGSGLQQAPTLQRGLSGIRISQI